jgi:hypothetical protein
MKWGFDFMGLVKFAARYIGNQYIIVATNYITKSVDVKALRDNTTKNTIKFILNKLLFVLAT